jgi:hypothetical protein
MDFRFRISDKFDFSSGKKSRVKEVRKRAESEDVRGRMGFKLKTAEKEKYFESVRNLEQYRIKNLPNE